MNPIRTYFETAHNYLYESSFETTPLNANSHISVEAQTIDAEPTLIDNSDQSYPSWLNSLAFKNVNSIEIEKIQKTLSKHYGERLTQEVLCLYFPNNTHLNSAELKSLLVG